MRGALVGGFETCDCGKLVGSMCSRKQKNCIGLGLGIQSVDLFISLPFSHHTRASWSSKTCFPIFDDAHHLHISSCKNPLVSFICPKMRQTHPYSQNLPLQENVSLKSRKFDTTRFRVLRNLYFNVCMDDWLILCLLLLGFAFIS